MTMPTPTKRSFFARPTGRIFLLVVGLAVVLVAGGVFVGIGRADASRHDNVPVFTVAQGPLTISVTESGTISAREQVVIKSEVEGRATIIFLIDEGEHVKEGDLLVELDSSALQSQLVDQQIKVQNNEASLIQASEALEVAKNQAEADVAQAELTFRFAQQDLSKYNEGEYPMQLKEARNNITLAEEEKVLAEKTLEDSQTLANAKYISDNELERDRLAFRRAELKHELAEEALKLLETYTKPRQIAQLESDVEQAEMALERIIRSARAEVIKAESTLRAAQLQYDRELEEMHRLEDQIAKCKIVAPTAGMVVYATTGQGGWRGNQEPLQEGQEVREREELIKLPTASAMSAEVKIHESSLDKIRVGQPVRITVEALPGKIYRGRVRRIAPLPDAQSVWLNPDLKVYATVIDLEGELSDLRTGMTCRAEIVVDHYNDAVYVPVQAVVRIGQQPTVYVRDRQTMEPRPVELGLHNNRMVRIIKGIEPGEVVTLAPPLAPAQLDDEFAFARAGEEPEGANSAAAMAAEMRVAAASTEPMATPAAEAAPQAAGDGTREAGASPDSDQRARMREAFERMTPEQREAARSQMRQRRSAAGEGGTP